MGLRLHSYMYIDDLRYLAQVLTTLYIPNPAKDRIYCILAPYVKYKIFSAGGFFPGTSVTGGHLPDNERGRIKEGLRCRKLVYFGYILKLLCAD